jgi:parallel beta-helix repeat protein
MPGFSRPVTVDELSDTSLHASASAAHRSSHVIVEDNVFRDNAREQLYLIRSDNNVIRRNLATGGTQGLEMRFSSDNAFSYNVWAGSPLQFLENDNNDNTFFYERFEGRVAVGDASTGNRFELSSFSLGESIPGSVRSSTDALPESEAPGSSIGAWPRLISTGPPAPGPGTIQAGRRARG